MDVIIPRRNRRRPVAMPFRYTYSGQSDYTEDGSGNWELRLYGQGRLTVQSTNRLDIFAVGPGGEADGRIIAAINYDHIEMMAGGGGRTETVTNKYLIPGHNYQVSSDASLTTIRDRTDDENIITVSVASVVSCGSGGAGLDTTSEHYDDPIYYSGGVDGGSGGGNNGFAGQGTTTRAFGETTGELFSTGGGVGFCTSVGYQPSTYGDGGAIEYNNNNGTFVKYDPWPGLIIIRNARG